MEKLYYFDSEMTGFEAAVVSCTDAGDGRFLVSLDQTAFYPEGGGQPYDTGTLGGVRVLEVHEKNGQVLHTTDGPLTPGTTVRGAIDWDRRFRHMQNHSGEHILSGIIHRRFGYDNVGFHMGSDAVTIDFNGILTPEQLAECEAEANRLVYADIPVEIDYPDAEALARLDYRSKKELTGQVRIVTIPGGDVCACCGTHVKRTGSIGIIKTTGMIHYKGGVRISMLCGMDARDDYEKRLSQVTDISRQLSAKADRITDAVAKLKAESTEKDMLIGRLYQQLFAAKVASLPDSCGPLLLVEEGLSPVQLRQLCTLIYEQNKAGVAAVCSWNGNAFGFALGSKTVDVRPLSKELNQRLAGRGGGSSLMVQGMWNAPEGEIRAAFESVAGAALNGD